MEGLSTGIKVPSGKGKRLIIVHIGSEEGFLKEGLLTYQTCDAGDYHQDMNSNVFEDYFGEMIKYLPAGSVVVLDNEDSNFILEKTRNYRLVNHQKY